MQFIIGLILGAILGVLADRLWSWVERIIRVDIKGGYFQNIKREEGFHFAITNKGTTDIPPYRICIFHPQRGSLFVFSIKENVGTLIPGQTDEHQCVVLKQGKVDTFLANWFFHVKNEQVTHVDITKFAFQMVMDKSKKVLWQSNSIGNALANQFVKVITEKNFKGITYQEAMAIETSTQPYILKLIRKLCPPK
jgi:hypothetical protein